MPNLREQRRAIQKELRGFIGKAVQQIGRNVTRNLVEATPKDTTYAASNWIPNIGSPLTEPVGIRPRRPSRSIRSTTAGNILAASIGGSGLSGAAGSVAPARAAQAAGLASLAGYEIENGAVYISNAVRYIVFLNRGHSAQAPSMYVERTIARTVSATRIRAA